MRFFHGGLDINCFGKCKSLDRPCGSRYACLCVHVRPDYDSAYSHPVSLPLYLPWPVNWLLQIHRRHEKCQNVWVIIMKNFNFTAVHMLNGFPTGHTWRDDVAIWCGHHDKLYHYTFFMNAVIIISSFISLKNCIISQCGMNIATCLDSVSPPDVYC